MTSTVQAMRELLFEDKRYKMEAYQFIRESLQFAQENSIHLPATAIDESDDLELVLDQDPRHVTGQQLCEACRQYGIEQYGYLAPMVLESWGIKSSGDLGELVYNLIRIGQMHKSESDRREDFDDVFDFETAFVPRFEFVGDGADNDE